MGRWKKDATEFNVGVNYVEDRGYSSSLPRPVIEKLGNPDTITYVLKDGGGIEVIGDKFKGKKTK
jgi:hypothetical protein